MDYQTTYETARLLALSFWVSDEALTIADEHEVSWAGELVAAGFVFA